MVAMHAATWWLAFDGALPRGAVAGAQSGQAPAGTGGHQAASLGERLEAFVDRSPCHEAQAFDGHELRAAGVASAHGSEDLIVEGVGHFRYT